MYSFHMLGFIYILVISEKYFLLVVIHVLLLGLIILLRNNYQSSDRKKHLKVLGFSANSTRKNFQVIFTMMILNT